MTGGRNGFLTLSAEAKDVSYSINGQQASITAGNTKPPLLSDEWLKPNARLFFAEYEAMMLAHCQPKWAKVITADDEKKSGESAAGYQFQWRQRTHRRNPDPHASNGTNK